MDSEFYSPRSGRRVAEMQQDSYHALTVKKLSATQQMVMDCFDSVTPHLTREDIATITNLKLSSVCGRVRELLDANRLTVVGKREDTATGHSQQLLGVPSHG